MQTTTLALGIAALLALCSACSGSYDNYQGSLQRLQSMIRATEDAKIKVKTKGKGALGGDVDTESSLNATHKQTVNTNSDDQVTASSFPRNEESSATGLKKKSRKKKTSSGGSQCMIVSQKTADGLMAQLPTRRQMAAYGVPLAVTVLAYGVKLCLDASASHNPLCSLSNLAECFN